MSLKSNDFLKQMNQSKNETFRMGTVASISSGLKITFFGEESPSGKTYKRLSSYSPVLGDVVCVAKVNGSWLVLGKIV